jgi:UDP-N-acetylglucosamine 2-epimerase (non-hydrolysing)
LRKNRKILFIFGTRPEAIKLCPVVLYFQRYGAEFDTQVTVSAQHRGLLDQVLTAFAVTPGHDLNVMQPGQTLFQSTGRILMALEEVFHTEQPDMVFVQGDTTTTLCGALSAFYQNVPVAHVEAGLRTGDLRQPFPEEMNRVVTTRLTALHLPPTEGAAANLRREGIADKDIHVTGNTGIDALLEINARIDQGLVEAPDWKYLDPCKKTILVTGHRRESFGEGFLRICRALRKLAERPDVEMVYPVHPNPNVRGIVESELGGRENIHLIDPLEYVPFVSLMRRCDVILTDSGGVQEEAPSLGKPVLVMREKTERPEAIEAGTSRLVGTDVEKIVNECTLLLDDRKEYARRAAIHNPYGDGKSSGRILDAVREYFAGAKSIADANG